MDLPCKCPPPLGEPNNYKAYTCQENTIYINYIMSLLLLRTTFYNYLQTGVNQAPDLKNKYSYIVPIYKFKYYSLINPQKVLKTYTYQQLFNIFIVAQQFKNIDIVPFEVKDNWDNVDLELYENILLLPIIEPLYQAIANANAFRQKGLNYSYTFTLPSQLAKKAPQGQIISKCYSRDELITISRNAQLIVNAYMFNGAFPYFSPENPV